MDAVVRMRHYDVRSRLLGWCPINSEFGCQDEVVYEQRVLADRPVRMDVIETEQQMEKQMENRLINLA